MLTRNVEFQSMTGTKPEACRNSKSITVIVTLIIPYYIMLITFTFTCFERGVCKSDVQQ